MIELSAVFRFIWIGLVVSLALGCAANNANNGADGPDARLGEPSNEIDPAVIGEVVRANPGRFQRCYELGRERNPSLTGRIEIRFLIHPDGSVGPAQAVESNLPSEVSRCVLSAFSSLQMPAQSDPVIAQYPMFFQPG